MILLVRHGQASWGAADYDALSDLGHRQSAVLGRALADRGLTPTCIVAGSMRRHAETAAAAVAAAGWGADVVVDHGWDEFDHEQMLAVHGPPDGSVAGQLTRQQFDAWFGSAMRRWTAGENDEEYDESFQTFSGRVDQAMRRTAAGLGSGDAAVVFSSGGPISWVAATLLGGGVDMWMRLNPVTVNASLCRVVVGSRGTTLLSVNEHGHLAPEDVTYR